MKLINPSFVVVFLCSAFANNFVLLATWLHRDTPMPCDSFPKIHRVCSHSVCEPKGTELSRLALCIPTPPKQGDLGLHQWLSAYWQRFVTYFQRLLCTQSECHPLSLSQPVLMMPPCYSC